VDRVPHDGVTVRVPAVDELMDVTRQAVKKAIKASLLADSVLRDRRTAGSLADAGRAQPRRASLAELRRGHALDDLPNVTST
jgi:hypothetical protein